MPSASSKGEGGTSPGTTYSSLEAARGDLSSTWEGSSGLREFKPHLFFLCLSIAITQQRAQLYPALRREILILVTSWMKHSLCTLKRVSQLKRGSRIQIQVTCCLFCITSPFRCAHFSPVTAQLLLSHTSLSCDTLTPIFFLKYCDL